MNLKNYYWSLLAGFCLLFSSTAFAQVTTFELQDGENTYTVSQDIDSKFLGMYIYDCDRLID